MQMFVFELSSLVSHNVDRVLCVNRRVLVHPTTAVTSDSLRELYGCDMRLIRHDHHGILPETPERNEKEM